MASTSGARQLWLVLPLALALAGPETCDDSALLQPRKARHDKAALHALGANCSGFKCERGHGAFGKAKGSVKKHVFGGSESDYQFQINEDGKWNTYYLPGATIIDKRTVNYGINDKYYLMKTDTEDYSQASNFHKVVLAGKSMISSIKLNGAGCGCNVNFFLVNMPASSPGQYGDYYCDANCVGGNCCAEFDINEMNDAALQVTNHNCGTPPHQGVCDGNGDPLLRFTPGEFGVGSSNTIDTSYEFNFSLQVRETVVAPDSDQNYITVYVTLWQDGKTVIKSMGGPGSPLNVQWGNLAAGMVLVIDYWESSDLTWLDGAACSAPEQCSGKRADLMDMKIITNALASSSTCPASSDECSCANIDPNADDGSECWCRCACAETLLVPRCTWPGYTASWDQ